MSCSTPRTNSTAKNAGTFWRQVVPRPGGSQSFLKRNRVLKNKRDGKHVTASPAYIAVPCLILLTLGTWVPVARSQASNRPLSTASTAGTVSVRELQIPEKAKQAYRRGLERLTKEDPAASLQNFDKALESFPEYYQAYYHKGIAQMKLQDNDEALQSFQRAIDLSGGHFLEANCGYALALARLGQLGDAESVVRRALEQDTRIADGHVVLAIVLLTTHRLDEAEKSAREALLLPAAGSKKSYLVLADIHAARGDHAAQVRDLEIYLKAQPSDPDKKRLQTVLGAARRLAARTAANDRDKDSGSKIASEVKASSTSLE
jgi:tetratricopeptide (TPR) repeat protein